jgi:hypothetical protein
MQVLTRPFAVEPVTRIMLPDGIFDNAIYSLLITCHYTNTSGQDLTNVSLYLESVGDPGIVPVAKTHHFARIPAGASVRVDWMADFQHATPGKRLVSFVAQADGFTSARSIQQIFVSQTRFDQATNSYRCTIEEGTLVVSSLSAITPASDGWWKCDPKRPRCPPKGFGPNVLTGATMLWQPNPAFEGVHGELPFADPWWKILAIIVAVVAALVAIIAAALGGGKANFSVGGTFEETDPSVSCCTPKGAASGMPDYTVAGVASAIASGALVVACSDEADPFWRGQAATPPPDGALTLGEKVVAKWALPQAPNAGEPYIAEVEWTYERFTTAGTLSHSVSETQTNIHTAGEVEIETPDLVHAFEPLWCRARFPRLDGGTFAGNELYAFAVFQSPGGLSFVVDLGDDGLGKDPGANDGTYAGVFDLRGAYKILLEHNEEPYGDWRVFVYAQDVNLTKPGTPPEIAAQHIGGFFVSSAIHITFDPNLPCPLKAQGVIKVV